ncbi:MAG: hypothetical protein CSB49_04370 [Proteobacteria bacterium]|nr:MAG: hypothetical protein CSB49_04370 [Pseudomonadota bacterium]
MHVLREQREGGDLKRLREAWRARETFALLPAKMEVSPVWLEEALARLPEPLREEHFLLLTSGTTGQPKLVIGAKERAEALAALLHEVQDGDAAATATLALPISYCYALVNQFVWGEITGRPVVETRGFADPQSLAEALERGEDTMLCLVGAQLPLLWRFFSGRVFERVVRLHFAGGRFPQERLAELLETFPRAAIYNNYGCAEAMPRLTVRRAEDSNSWSNVGKPLPGIELRVGSAQQLTFRSRYGAVAIDEGKALQMIDAETWVATGDLAQASDDGSFSLLGRASEVFKRHGEKVSTSRVLSTVAEVWSRQAVAFRQADRNGEEGYVLVLCPEPDKAQLRTILRQLRDYHPRAHWPLSVEAVTEVPLLSNGKVDPRALAGSKNKKQLWRQRI